MAFRVGKVPSFLYDNGIRYHERGKLTKNKVALFDYYKTDSITAEQKATILKWCKDARFFNSRREYAPEQRSVLIAFPKAGFYRHGFAD